MSQWKGILKIQRPITSNMVNPPVLIYSKDRMIFTEQLMTEQEMDDLFGEAMKVYVQAELADNGTLFIDSSTTTEEGDF